MAVVLVAGIASARPADQSSVGGGIAGRTCGSARAVLAALGAD